MIVPNPSSSRNPGSSPTSRSLTRSRPRPLSRNTYAVSGEITYGGLQTTSPNVSPATGSKKLPGRNSMLSTSLRAAFSAAKASARSLTSVATTLLGVARGEQRLDAAAGPDVERRPDRAPDGEVGQRQRWPMETGDVVRPGAVGVGQVRREHDPAVRDEPDHAAQLAPCVVRHHPERLEGVDGRADRPLHDGRVDGLVEQEQADQGLQAPVADPRRRR